jgi:MFS family permease
MTQTASPHVADATVLVADRVTAIFLAVLWFSAFDDILQQVIPSHHHWWILILQCLVMLTAATMLAWSLRQKSFGLAAFCAVGAHFSSFMGTHMALNVQKNHFVLSPIHTAFGFLVVALLFLLVCGFLYIIKKTVLHIRVGSKSRDESVNEFMDRFDDTENDFVAMSLAAYWVMVVRFMITQHYPEDGEVEPGETPPHTGPQRLWLLMFSIALLVIGLIAVHFLSNITINGYVPNRCADIFKAFMINSWVFALIFWAEMEFFEHPYLSTQPIVTRIFFASVVTMATAVCVLVCAPLSTSAGARTVLLYSSALATGIAWEETFDAALDSYYDPYKNVHWMKGATVLGISAFVLPAYVIYFKPYTFKAEADKTDASM